MTHHCFHCILKWGEFFSFLFGVCTLRFISPRWKNGKTRKKTNSYTSYERWDQTSHIWHLMRQICHSTSTIHTLLESTHTKPSQQQPTVKQVASVPGWISIDYILITPCFGSCPSWPSLHSVSCYHLEPQTLIQFKANSNHDPKRKGDHNAPYCKCPNLVGILMQPGQTIVPQMSTVSSCEF